MLVSLKIMLELLNRDNFATIIKFDKFVQTKQFS